MLKLSLPRTGTLAAALAAAPALLLLALAGADLSGATATSVPATVPRDPAAVASPPSPLYRQAALSAARGDLAGAKKLLEPVAAAGGAEAARSRTVLGLLAWKSGDCASAAEWLAPADFSSALADWRLHALADCALAAPAAPASSAEASSALASLVRDFPRSPLADLAVLRLAELAWSASDAAGALEWIALGRTRELAAADRARLDALAFAIGRATGDRAVETEAARRLLVAAPLEAARLEVAAALAAHGDDWRLLLDEPELLRRTESLLAVDVPEGALLTLQAIAPSRRGFEWKILEARALLAAGKPGDTFARLNGLAGESGDDNARLLLLRARAAEEAATVHRGRTNPPVEERARLRAVARASRVAAAELATSPDLRRDALTTLFADFESDGRMEEAIEVLRRLSPLDPSGQTGARALWERGWREYRGANYSGAIGYWSELVGLYPAGSFSRAAAYWSARAHDALGEKARAASGYRAITETGTRDFYAQQSYLRLAGKPTAPPPAPEGQPGAQVAIAREPWPTDRGLERARLLSDLGLDALAATEIDALAEASDPRATAALRGLVLSRSGNDRESLRELKKAFPRLGTVYQASAPREALELYYPRPFADRVALFAGAQRLPSSLVFGIIHQESGFDPSAKSRSGARGLMQIMPATGREVARRIGLPFSPQSLYEPDTSLRLGTTYFRQIMGQFDGRIELALAGYNGGPGRIGRLWREQGATRGLDLFLEDLSVEESRTYVKRIVLLAESYRSLYSDLS